MDFQPDADQQALVEAVHAFCEGEFPPTRLKELAAGDTFDPKLWRGLSDIGIFSLALPEAEGGAGLGMAEAALVLEELGRWLVPGPLVGSLLGAGLLSGIAIGSPVGVIDADDQPQLVEHLAVLAGLVVMGESELRWIRGDQLEATAVAHPMDPLTPLHRLDLRPEGEPLGGAEAALAWRQRGAVLTAALQVGIARAVTDAAVAYAKQREQFGRMVAGFQAVKHICADMLVRTDLARAATYAAAVTLDDPEVGDLGRLVASAKMLADEAATANGRAAVQVYGGMGYTWEVDVHFYLKRSWVYATHFGTADEHADAMAQLL
jgi:alkylation response protein AidB-like acyl-CoA dehydrogenase